VVINGKLSITDFLVCVYEIIDCLIIMKLII
jgi:hypothetical protein